MNLALGRWVHASAVAFISAGAFVACSSGSSDVNGAVGGTGAIQGEAGVYTCPGLGVSVFHCPSGTLTYTENVAPILAARCTGCHGPGGENANVPLTSYAGVITVAGIAGSLALNCNMPPPPLPPLTLDEMTTLNCWLDTGRKK